LFANVETSPAYEEFLNYLGEKIPLQGWTKFRGGLDVKQNTKGTHSLYTAWNSFQIMFHVATLLPYNLNDEQQLERKNMIGNDIIVIVFSESCERYVPSTIASHMNHIVVVVKPEINPKTNKTLGYWLGLACKDSVPQFLPPLPEYLEVTAFRHFFLSKLINGLLSARKSPSFTRLFSIPRTHALIDIIEHKTKKQASLVKKLLNPIFSQTPSDSKPS